MIVQTVPSLCQVFDQMIPLTRLFNDIQERINPLLQQIQEKDEEIAALKRKLADAVAVLAPPTDPRRSKRRRQE